MKLASLYSGGKDSTYAVYWALKNNHSVECLITIHPERDDSYMYHVPNIHLTKYSAEAMEIPLVTKTSTGVKEEELRELEEVLEEVKSSYGIHGITTGALCSNYQASRIQAICDKLGLECFNPLWQMDQEEYMRLLVKENFKVMICAVSCGGIDHSWLGRVIDDTAIDELIRLRDKMHFNLAFEGGEMESLVLDCPIFKKKLEVVESEPVWHGIRGELKVKEVKLVNK